MNYFVKFSILCMYFDIFLPTALGFMLSRYILSARWYVLNMWYMNFDVYIFLLFVMIFHNFFGVLCSVLRVSSESDLSRRDRSVSVPAESATETETLNHGSISTTVVQTWYIDAGCTTSTISWLTWDVVQFYPIVPTIFTTAFNGNECF